MQSTGHSKALRDQLKRRRLQLDLTQADVAELIERETGRSCSGAAVSAWENFTRHPLIDAFAAWARVLGTRLLVDLADGEQDAVTVPRQRADQVREFALLDERDARYVESLLRLLPQMDERDRRMLRGDLKRIEDEIRLRRGSQSTAG